MIRSILFKLGLKKILLKNRYGERILVFHGIDKVGETRFNSRFFSEEYFERFIQYITTHFNVISLDDYYSKNFKADTLNIALTFDDGYYNNFKYALPLLKKHNVPASFYITTVHQYKAYLWPDFLDLISFHSDLKQVEFLGKLFVKNDKKEFVHKGKSLKQFAKTIDYKSIEILYETLEAEWKKLPLSKLDTYWQLMDQNQIKEIADHPLFTIGSHAVTHVNLKEVNADAAKAEILNSKNILENLCGVTCDEFAFPFGVYTKELAEYCLSVGYKKVLLLDYNDKEDKCNEAYKNRFMLNPYISMDMQLLSLLEGRYY